VGQGCFGRQDAHRLTSVPSACSSTTPADYMLKDLDVGKALLDRCVADLHDLAYSRCSDAVVQQTAPTFGRDDHVRRIMGTIVRDLAAGEFVWLRSLGSQHAKTGARVRARRSADECETRQRTECDTPHGPQLSKCLKTAPSSGTAHDMSPRPPQVTGRTLIGSLGDNCVRYLDDLQFFPYTFSFFHLLERSSPARSSSKGTSIQMMRGS
jgi:hypothetical protein